MRPRDPSLSGGLTLTAKPHCDGALAQRALLGARGAGLEITGSGGAALAIELRDVSVSSLADLSETGVCGAGDLIAGVLSRFDGALPVTGVVGMDPEEALALVRSSLPARDPLEAYVEIGRALLAGVTAGVCEPLGRLDPAGAPSLEEEPLVAIVLRTHAPSDTSVLMLELRVRCQSVACPVFVYLLLEPKQAEALLVEIPEEAA